MSAQPEGARRGLSPATTRTRAAAAARWHRRRATLEPCGVCGAPRYDDMARPDGTDVCFEHARDLHCLADDEGSP